MLRAIVAEPPTRGRSFSPGRSVGAAARAGGPEPPPGTAAPGAGRCRGLEVGRLRREGRRVGPHPAARAGALLELLEGPPPVVAHGPRVQPVLRVELECESGVVAERFGEGVEDGVVHSDLPLPRPLPPEPGGASVPARRGPAGGPMILARPYRPAAGSPSSPEGTVRPIRNAVLPPVGLPGDNPPDEPLGCRRRPGRHAREGRGGPGRPAAPFVRDVRRPGGRRASSRRLPSPPLAASRRRDGRRRDAAWPTGSPRPVPSSSSTSSRRGAPASRS